MSALTSSIAHELGQPLSCDDPQRPSAAGRWSPPIVRRPTRSGRSLSDIQSQGVQATQIIDRHRTMLRSHQLDMKPIDLHAVIRDSLALVDHDMKARQIEAIVDLSSSPCIIDGDQVLLQQVLVNLVINAMDAMAETPPARRRITISSDVRAADVEVSVRDTGTGVPAQIIEHAVHAIRHDEIARPRDRPDDRTVDRRRAWRHHRRPQQSRRGRDIYRHAAPQRSGLRGRGATLGAQWIRRIRRWSRIDSPNGGQCCPRDSACCLRMTTLTS